MKRSSFLIVSLSAIAIGSVIISEAPNSSAAASQPSSTATATLQAVVVPAATSSAAAPTAQPAAPTSAPSPVPAAPLVPVLVSIPSALIQSPVVPVGVNAKGEMDVPKGSTNNVGWYKDGVIPGNVGSAVLDAHVFAAFENLHRVIVGDSVYVRMSDGSTLRFVVRATKTALLSELTPDMLFQQTDGRHLNLITCAGSLTPDHSTYDHRLIVYTELVN